MLVMDLLPIHTVVVDVIAFIVIVLIDVPLPGWVYPFLFYIHVRKGPNCDYFNSNSLIITQVVPSVGTYFPESFIKGGKFVSVFIFNLYE